MQGEPTVNRGMVCSRRLSLDSLLARRTGRFLRKGDQETTQEMVDPLSEGWVDLLSEGKKEKRRQVERKLVPFLLPWRRTVPLQSGFIEKEKINDSEHQHIHFYSGTKNKYNRAPQHPSLRRTAIRMPQNLPPPECVSCAIRI